MDHDGISDGDQDDDGVVSFLDQNTDQAEARLAARRQARAEARDIRMREVERQQKEAKHGGPALAEPIVRTTPRSRATNHSSRRSSEDSLEEGGSLRDTRMELKELEEKFRKAMIQNAQLDNEKASLGYQLGLLKDQSEDLLEAHTQLGREHRDKCRAHDQLARANHRLGEELELANAAWAERDRLIAERGLAIAGDGDERCLVSVDAANTLAGAGQGSLDVRLSRLAEERADLADQLRRAQAELSERRRDPAQSGAGSGAAKDEEDEANREAARMLQEARFRLQKADQDVATLQATVARLESQVVRYKASSESSELAENELKVERRKLQRHDLDDEAASTQKGSEDEEEKSSENEGDDNMEKDDSEKEDDGKQADEVVDGESTAESDRAGDDDKEDGKEEKEDEKDKEENNTEENSDKLKDSKDDQGIICADVNDERKEKNNADKEPEEGVDKEGIDVGNESNAVIDGKEDATESSEEEESEEESEEDESSEEGSTAGGSSSR